MAPNAIHHHRLSGVSLSSIMAQIAYLDQLDLSRPDMVVLKSHIDKLLTGFPIIKAQFPLTCVYRARKVTPQPSNILEVYTHPFRNVKDLWYPPPEKITLPGRVNRSDKVIFYCSSTEACALAEKEPRIGDVITVLECRLVPSSFPVFYAWDLARFAVDNHPYQRMASTIRSEIGRGNMFKFHTIGSYLDGHFTKTVLPGNEHEYYITIAIFELLMEKDRTDIGPSLGSSDGLSYQSIAWESGANFALKASSADRLLIPACCRMLVIRNVSHDPTTYDWILLNEARDISEDGNIHWKWNDDKRKCLY